MVFSTASKSVPGQLGRLDPFFWSGKGDTSLTSLLHPGKRRQRCQSLPKIGLNQIPTGIKKIDEKNMNEMYGLVASVYAASQLLRNIQHSSGDPRDE